MMRATKTLKGVFLSTWGRGKATLLTVMVALTLATVTPAFAANGQPLIMGVTNNVATAITKLTANIAGPALYLSNLSSASSATALTLQTRADRPPMVVNSAKKVGNLNADRVDGLDSTQLQGARAYAHINEDGTIDPSRSKNVNRSLKFPPPVAGTYCLNSTVTPHNVVATVDHIPGGPGEFGEIVKQSDNGATVCSSDDTTYNIAVNTANSAGTAEDRAFDIVIN